MDLRPLAVVLVLCQHRLAAHLVDAVVKALCDLGEHGLQRHAHLHAARLLQPPHAHVQDAPDNAADVGAPVVRVDGGGGGAVERGLVERCGVHRRTGDVKGGGAAEGCDDGAPAGAHAQIANEGAHDVLYLYAPADASVWWGGDVTADSQLNALPTIWQSAATEDLGACASCALQRWPKPCNNGAHVQTGWETSKPARAQHARDQLLLARGAPRALGRRDGLQLAEDVGDGEWR